METTGRREEETTMLCRILAMPVKHWLFILTLILLFLALYARLSMQKKQVSPVAIFKAGWLVLSTFPSNNVKICSAWQTGFYDDTAAIRNKIVEKRFELKDLSKNSESRSLRNRQKRAGITYPRTGAFQKGQADRA